MTHLSTLMPLPEIQSERARETKTAPKLVQDIRAKLVVQKNKVSIVGIDGPTAAGKTILADALRDHLLAEGIPTSVFRFDWTLKDRESRVADLLHLRKEPFSFEHEAELHMNLQVVENFLKQIVHFNESEDVMNGERVIELSDLYNRSDDGKLTGAARFHLKAGTVIILEGHYTLRNDFDKYIDLNVVLLARWEELLKRKIARVKDYRDADATNDYFWRIDVPSFRNHLRRFGLNADMVVENTDYNSPVLSSIAEVEKWLSYDDSRLLQSRSIFGDGSIGDFVVSNSLFASADLKRAIEAAIRAIKKWDHKADQFLRVNIQSLESDLTTFASNLVRELNTSAQDGYEFRITHHDSLHNVYYRKLPFSLSIGIFEVQRKSPVVSLLADIFQSELSIQIVWAGGYHKVHVVRQLGEIANVSRSTVKDATGEYLCATDSTGAIPVMLPTDFTLPPFLKTQDFRLVYIRKESEVMSPSQALSKLLREKGVWIQRFSLFSELQFFRDVMQHIGIHCVQIANYLIGINHPSPTLREQFFEFAQEWRTPLEKVALFEKSASEMDALVVAERHEAATYVKEHCPNFLMMDGYLFSDFLYGDDRKLNDGLLQLKQMLLHRNRLVRKRATEFIGKNFPLLDLPTEKLWNTIPSNARKSIYLEEFVRISPTILAEVYLWMSIRKERAAILGCNIYDVREHSIDSRAYLAAAQKKGVPIVLQGSLNALGQSEVDESGATQHGYLKLANGPVDFVNAAMTSARDLFLTSGVLPPLFGIGLDHVTSKYDTPKGRAKRFLKLAADTGLLTHYVADGEGLYDSSHESGNPYAAMAEFSAELTHDLPSQYTLDREICAGELNYVDKISKVQTVKDMKVFMRAYQEALEK